MSCNSDSTFDFHPRSALSPLSPHVMAEESLAVALAEQRKRKAKLLENEAGDNDVICSERASGENNDRRHSHSSEGQRNTAGNGGQNSMLDFRLQGRNDDTFCGENNEDDLENVIGQVWDEFAQDYVAKRGSTNGDTFDDAKEAVLEASELILGKLIDALIRSGLEGFHELETVTRDAISLDTLVDARQRELQRLQASETQSRVALAVSHLF